MLIQKLRGKVDHIDHEKGRLFLNVGVSNRCIVLDWNKDYEPVDEIMNEIEVGIDEVLEIHCEINGTEWLGYNDGNRLKGEIFSVRGIEEYLYDEMDLDELNEDIKLIKGQIRTTRLKIKSARETGYRDNIAANKDYIATRKRHLEELEVYKQQLKLCPDESAA